MVYFILYHIKFKFRLATTHWRALDRREKGKGEGKRAQLMGKWRRERRLEGKKASTAFIRRRTDFAMLCKVDELEKLHNMDV